MAPENTKTDSEKAVEERDLRRKKVIQALRTSHSEMRDDKFRAKELALSTQNALDTLWDKGLNDPSRTSGSNFVEWWIDRDLWARMRGGRFPYPRPEQFGSPGSSKLVDYQRERLAKLATEKAAAEKAAAEKAAAEKTAAEKTAAEKAANDTAAKEAADKARGAQSGSAPPALAPTTPPAPQKQSAPPASQLKRKLEDNDSADTGPTIKKRWHPTGVPDINERVHTGMHNFEIAGGDADPLHAQPPPNKPSRLYRRKSW